LGIAEQMKSKARIIESVPVGRIVASGDAEIWFQQISELLPVPGIDFAGPLPAVVQKITVFSAGIAVGSTNQDAARTLIKFLASPRRGAAIRKSGLEPITSR